MIVILKFVENTILNDKLCCNCSEIYETQTKQNKKEKKKSKNETIS